LTWPVHSLTQAAIMSAVQGVSDRVKGNKVSHFGDLLTFIPLLPAFLSCCPLENVVLNHL
jgi:NADH:ubiquinone oxidoreductase subunit 4 (subunit M)